MTNDQILDLDNIAPVAKVITINGKQYKCNPLTIRQMVGLVKIDEQLRANQDIAKTAEIVDEMLRLVVPDLVSDKVDLTAEQIRAIIDFAQASSVPQNDEVGSQAAKEYPIKKKENSPKQ